MTTDISAAFPDAYFDLQLRYDRRKDSLVLRPYRIQAKLDFGIYRTPEGTHTEVSELNVLERQDPACMPERYLYCLENEIPASIELMKNDILAALDVLISKYQEDGYIVEADNHLKLRARYAGDILVLEGHSDKLFELPTEEL